MDGRRDCYLFVAGFFPSHSEVSWEYHTSPFIPSGASGSDVLDAPEQDPRDPLRDGNKWFLAGTAQSLKWSGVS